MNENSIETQNILFLIFSAIVIGQFFGLFNISGVFSKDHKSLKFNWYSLRTLYSTCFVIGGIFNVYSVFKEVYSAKSLNPNNIGL